MQRCNHCAHTLDVGLPGAYCACLNCLNPVYWPENESVPPVPLPPMVLPGTVFAEILSGLYGVIRALPALPAVAQRVVSLIHDPVTSARDLAANLSEDPVLAMRVLKVANSAAYGGLREITDLDSACARLGMKAIAQLMWSVIGREVHGHSRGRFADQAQRLWLHALATGRCSEWVGYTLPPGEAHTVFLAGLVHDIGKVVLLDLIAGHRSARVQALCDTPEMLAEVVYELHGLVGLHVVQFMNLPREVRATTFLHHAPRQACSDRARTFAHVVAVADRLVWTHGYGVEDLPPEGNGKEDSAAILGLTEERMALLDRRVTEDLSAFVGSLQDF